jgi:hypothetical protein
MLLLLRIIRIRINLRGIGETVSRRGDPVTQNQ